MIDGNSRLQIPAGLADVLYWRREPGFETRPTRRQLAEAVSRHVEGWVRDMSDVTMNYLCNVADEIGFLVQNRHSVDTDSTALKVARDVNQGDVIKMATVIQDCDWSEERVSGRVKPALARVVEQKTAALVAKILKELIDAGHLSELGKPKGSHPKD